MPPARAVSPPFGLSFLPRAALHESFDGRVR